MAAELLPVLRVLNRVDRPRYDERRAPVAQWIERGRPKAGVGGSNPSGGATDARRAFSATLFISKKTASVHVANIKGKLGANSRIEIALVAQRLGLA